MTLHLKSSDSTSRSCSFAFPLAHNEIVLDSLLHYDLLSMAAELHRSSPSDQTRHIQTTEVVRDMRRAEIVHLLLWEREREIDRTWGWEKLLHV